MKLRKIDRFNYLKEKVFRKHALAFNVAQILFGFGLGGAFYYYCGLQFTNFTLGVFSKVLGGEHRNSDLRYQLPLKLALENYNLEKERLYPEETKEQTRRRIENYSAYLSKQQKEQ